MELRETLLSDGREVPIVADDFYSDTVRSGRPTARILPTPAKNRRASVSS
jgi:hypothetical protein